MLNSPTLHIYPLALACINLNMLVFISFHHFNMFDIQKPGKTCKYIAFLTYIFQKWPKCSKNQPLPDWQQFAVKWLIFEVYHQHHVIEHKILYQKLEKTKIGPGPPPLALMAFKLRLRKKLRIVTLSQNLKKWIFFFKNWDRNMKFGPDIQNHDI